MESLWASASLLADPWIWLFILSGVAVGVVFGSLPGFTATMGLAVCVPLTFALPPEQALALLLGLLSAAVFSGGVPAILINTPGTPASIATSWDGYPMARSGESGRALRINATGAFAGQTLSILLLALAAIPISRLALRFGPAEYFALAVFGISLVVSISRDSVLKGLATACVGLLIGTVGIDAITGFPRFSFGTAFLLNGVSFVPVMVGLFGLAEVFVQMSENRSSTQLAEDDQGAVQRPGLSRLVGDGAFGASVGSVVGAIPGAGGDIGSILAWEQSRRLFRNTEDYGSGSSSGLVTATTASNASIGGAMTTMLTLGIPGDSVSAVLIGALTLHGLQPGPLLFRDHPEQIGNICFLLLGAAILTLIVGLIGTKPFSRLLDLPSRTLWALIIPICLVGSYALNNSMADVWVALAAGVVGFVLKRSGYPLAPLVLALILGPMAESNLRRALIVADGGWPEILMRPVAGAILLLTLISLAGGILRTYRSRRTRKDTIDR